MRDTLAVTIGGMSRIIQPGRSMTAPTAKWTTLGFAIMNRLSSAISAAAPNATTSARLRPRIASIGCLRHLIRASCARPTASAAPTAGANAPVGA